MTIPSNFWNTAFAAVFLSAALAAIAVGWADPASAADSPDKQTIEKGHQIYLTAGGVGCAACHGPYGEGDVGIGPYNRGLGELVIQAALIKVEPMKFLKDELSDADIKAVAAYTEWLGEMKLVKALAKLGRFVPDRVEVHPGDRIQIVVQNASAEPHTFTSSNLGVGDITVEGRQDLAVTWEAPAAEGAFSLKCADCKLKNQQLNIVVTRKAEKFVPTKPTSKLMAEAPAPSAAPAAPSKAPQVAALTPAEKALAKKGREVFLNAGEVGCVACHGKYAEGDVGIGPYNRGFSERAIRKALAGVSAMAFLHKELNEEQILAVAAYYRSLSHIQLVKTVAVRGVFVPDALRIHPGTTIQLVVMNSSVVPRTYSSGDMGIKPFTVPGRGGADIEWVAPNSPGIFTLVCDDCQIKGQKLTVEVTKEVPPYAPPVALK